MQDVVDRIREVWGDHDDFQRLGMEYVAFVISRDLRDMEEAEYRDEECVPELADICINALRKLDDMGRDPEREILDRLESRMEGETEDIAERYHALFEEWKRGL